MIVEQHIQKAKEVFMRYVAPDGLKPEYDGMTAYEIAELMLKEAKTFTGLFDINDKEVHEGHRVKIGNDIWEVKWGSYPGKVAGFILSKPMTDTFPKIVKEFGVSLMEIVE